MNGPATGSETAAFLGVKRSVTGRLWRLRAGDDRVALALSQRLGLPEVVGRVLAARNVGLDEAESFLNPTLRDLMPDPSLLQDMDVAVERLVAAIAGGERIAVFGDYDVDGATASSLLLRFFQRAGVPNTFYIPDRLTEGYGPNPQAMRKLAADGVSVVVTVDCGIASFEAMDAAAEAGLDVIIVDHHGAEARLPKACAVVNPNRLDEDGSLGHLAAVGVAFLLAVGCNRALRDAGWWSPARPEPDLRDLLDLVALGTVCDVVPLVGLNRAMVIQGLKVMAKRANPGMAALADVAGVKEAPGAYHLGYVMGPRVNAGGRVGESDLGTRLLSSNDPVEAVQIAQHLNELNIERQGLEATALEEAIAQVEGGAGVDPALVFAASEGWHPGVVGIVASRLAERYHRPACVAAISDGKAVGSGRSVPGLDLGAAIIAARQANMLIKGGGHAMAAGFTVDLARLEEVRAFLSGRLQDDVPEGGLVPTLSVDGAVTVPGATAELVETLEQVGPFGAGNSEPRFVIPDARIVNADVVGNAHVRVVIVGAGGGQRLKGICFRCLENPLGAVLLARDGASLHLAGRLRADTWGGRNGVQFMIDDVASVI